MSMQDLTFNEDAFDIIEQCPKGAVIFTADDCQPCAVFEEFLDSVIAGYEDVSFYKVDCTSEDADDLTALFEVEDTPTVVFISNGEEVGYLDGDDLADPAIFTAMIESAYDPV